MLLLRGWCPLLLLLALGAAAAGLLFLVATSRTLRLVWTDRNPLLIPTALPCIPARGLDAALCSSEIISVLPAVSGYEARIAVCVGDM
jgi:hypothetical protein